MYFQDHISITTGLVTVFGFLSTFLFVFGIALIYKPPPQIFSILITMCLYTGVAVYWVISNQKLKEYIEKKIFCFDLVN